jgi:hypothetical protein
MSRFDDYLDMAAHCVANARRTADARHRSVLIDIAATWCDLARELFDGATKGLERLAEIAWMVAELDSFDRRTAPPVEEFEPRMIPCRNPRIVH